MDIKEEIQHYQQENKLLRQLGTRQGFFQYYFELLPKSRTYREAFHTANEKHFELFGEHKYSNYHSFNNQLSNMNRKS